MKKREPKKFCCKNCKTDYFSSSMNSSFCSVECRKEYKVRDGKKLGEDYVICEICKRATSSATGVHLRNHPGWTAEKYKSNFPNSPVIPTNVLERITEGSKKAGARMREEEHKARLSERVRGEKNPMHRSKTTDEKRKSISPFSPHFYLKRNPELSLDEATAMAKDKISGHSIVSWVKKDYWVSKGYTEEESKKIVSEKQSTFSLEKCIEKHGEEKGNLIWSERQKGWKKKVFNDQTHISRGYSKIGEDFVNSILESLRATGYEDVDDILHGKDEKFIRTKENKVFKYDLTFPKPRKIIEFNGDFWHCNPNLFISDYYNKAKKMTAKEIWDYDTEKKEAAENNGYSIFYVWENEYRNNKFSTIKKCLDFLAS